MGKFGNFAIDIDLSDFKIEIFDENSLEILLNSRDNEDAGYLKWDDWKQQFRKLIFKKT